MAPARNLLRRHCDSYGRFSVDDAHPELYPVSGLMAEKNCQSGGNSKDQQEKDKKEKEEVGSSSKEGEESYEGWLQLGIGGDGGSGRRWPSSSNIEEASLERGSSSVTRRKRDLRELDLFSDRPPDSRPTERPSQLMLASVRTMAMAPPFPGAAGGYGYKLGVPSPSSAASSSTAPLPMPSGHSWGQFTHPLPSPSSSEGLDGDMMMNMRVVRPLPRPQTGVWCVLQAAHNQVKEPFLPQIPKSYLRMRDGRTTVSLLMKYLANKLGLEDESEVEITCRGQQLLPFLTLQHVRDNIWCSSETVEIRTDSPSTDHIMSLHYSRK